FRVVKEQLSRSVRKYDYIVVDCAPGISALSEATIRLADLIIVPTIPDFLSTYGLQSFCRSIWTGEIAQRSSSERPQDKLPHVLITRRRHVKEHERTITAIRNERTLKEPSFASFDTIIPESIQVPQALRKNGRSPTFTNKWGTDLVPLLSSLAQETKEA